MPKTRISKEDTINICHYFAYLKSTYSVSLTQLAEICPLEAKTIARYTSSNIAPNHALTENTLKNLVAAFKIIFEQENIPIPHELSREFLLSNQLQEFLDTLNSQTSTSDVNDDAAITTANKTMIQCDPKKSNVHFFNVFNRSIYICSKLFREGLLSTSVLSFFIFSGIRLHHNFNYICFTLFETTNRSPS